MSRGARSKSATHNSRDSSGIVQVLVAKKLGRSNDKQFEFLMLWDILIYLFLIQMPSEAFAKKLITENSPLPVANITSSLMIMRVHILRIRFYRRFS